MPNQRCGSTKNSTSTAVKPLDNTSKPVPASANSLPDLRLGAGDLVEIKVYAAPDLSDTARISGTGEITMPLIGTVKVAGMSVETAQKAIEQRLLSGGFMRDPHVSILVREFATQGISILGEVARPGIYPMLGSRRLFDAIAAAGGTTNRAGKTVTITHRDQPWRPQRAQSVAKPDRSCRSEPRIAARRHNELFAGITENWNRFRSN